MLLVNFGPMDQAMTQSQKIAAVIPAGYHKSELVQRELPPDVAHLTGEFAEFLAKRTLDLKRPKLLDPWGQELR